MDRERLNRIRNFQSEDWYPALVMRPLTILVMLITVCVAFALLRRTRVP